MLKRDAGSNRKRLVGVKVVVPKLRSQGKVGKGKRVLGSKKLIK